MAAYSGHETTRSTSGSCRPMRNSVTPLLLVVGRSQARRDRPDRDGGAGRAPGGGSVFRYADTGEQQPRDRFTEQTRHETVDERHAGGAGTLRVGKQMEPAFDEAGGELRLAILPV